VKALRSLMKKVSKGEGGFTLIELLIVIIILGILAAVVAFNVGGFLGAGTEETAKTEFATMQTAIISCMAACSAGTVSTGTAVTGDVSNVTVVAGVTPASKGILGTYLQSTVHGYYTWGADGVITASCYDGGGKKCRYSAGAWQACESGTCNGTG